MGKKKKGRQNPTIRPPTGKSDFAAVAKSDATKGGAEKPPPPPTIKLKKIADFVAGTIADVPAHIASHVQWAGGGTVQYAPTLDSVDQPRKYNITVTVDGAPATPAPVKLEFAILWADPALTVDSPWSFDYGTVKDIPAEIKSRVHHKSTGEPEFTPALDTVGNPGDYAIEIQVPSHGNYKQSKKLTLDLSILKLKPDFKVSAVNDFDYLEKGMAGKIRRAVKVTAGGEPVFEPSPDSIQDPGDYEIQVYLAEADFYQESDPLPIKFKINVTSGFKSDAFKEWETANKALLESNKSIANKVQKKKYEIQNAKPGSYAKRAEIIDALNAEAGVPDRHIVWQALGYNLTSAQWEMPEKWTTTSGTQFHLTISADSIIVPNNRAAWAAAPAALFDTLFLSPVVARRVHLTLEETPSRHLFLGGVTGANKTVGDGWWGNQAGEMKVKLNEFRTRMIQKIGQLKTTFSL
jgi:hypothetical protein